MTYFKKVDGIYNPGQLTKQELIERFVVRHRLFNKIYQDIKTSDMSQVTENLLIVGLRGMGKTTLLLRISYEIEQDPDLNTWMLPVVFKEEQYGIRNLYSFWEHTAKYLEENYPLFSGLQERMNDLYDSNATDETYELKIFSLLISELQQHQKKLILLIDNLQDFLKKLSKQESQRLREVLMTTTDLRIVAAAPITVEAIHDHRHPLFEQFKPFHLKGLKREEAIEVLKMLAKYYQKEDISHLIEQEKGRLQAILQITGGVIRTIVLLFEIFMDDKNGNVFKDLDSILDRVTVLYKDRTDDLPKHQQAIVHAIAMNWDAISTKEIAQNTRLESKAVSSHLMKLAKNDWIDVIPTTTKNHLYRLKERFYNIWYLMRYGGKGDERRVLWLVKFFKEWYSEEDLKHRINDFVYNHQQDKSSFKTATSFLYQKETLNKYTLDVSDYLIFALAAQQYDFVLEFFNSEQGKKLNTKERLKPVWFALMHHLKDRFPNEYLKMGEEFTATVEEILAKIEEKRKLYFE